MGERTSRLTDGNGKAESRPPREIEREIETLRTRLDRSLAELDRRRHELTDIRLQMRKHPAVFIGAGVAVALMLGGVGFAIYRSRKGEELPQKAKRLRIAGRRALDQQAKLVRAQPPVWQKMAAAVGTTIAVSLAKKMVERSWNQTVEAGRS